MACGGRVFVSVSPTEEGVVTVPVSPRRGGVISAHHCQKGRMSMSLLVPVKEAWPCNNSKIKYVP